MIVVLLGAAAACAASVLYNVGVALQAREARATQTSGLRPGLVAQLARRRWWLAGTALGILGWPLQAVAFALAPIAVAQPALASGLIVLLFLGRRLLGERVTPLQQAGLVAILAGIVALTLVAPGHSTASGGPAVWGVLAALGVAALVPYGWSLRGPVDGVACAVSAGTAFAWSGLSTKLVADAAAQSSWAAAAMWTAATGGASLLALLSEMSALQRRPATVVAPLVFSVQVVLPVVLAPVAFAERWTTTDASVAVAAVALTAVVAGTVVLGRSRSVRAAEGAVVADG